MNYYEDNGWEREFLYHMPDLPFFGEWADNFDVDNYMDWFAPININTLIWQVVIVCFLWRFRKEIGKVVISIVAKIPQIESFSLTGVKLTDTTMEGQLKELIQVIKKNQTTKERE